MKDQGTNEYTDTAQDDFEERTALLTPRRLIRWTVVIAVGIVVMLAFWQDPVFADPDADPLGDGPPWAAIGAAGTLMTTLTLASRHRRRAAQPA